jgi:hypothetical protein
MAIKYKHSVNTRPLSRQECKDSLDEIVTIFKSRQDLKIEMMFGFAWGNEYKDWTPFFVSPDEIVTEIDKAEKSGTGSFYNDDTFLFLEESRCEIRFCHDYDIHLDFEEHNQVVDAILKAWKNRKIIWEEKEKTP